MKELSRRQVLALPLLGSVGVLAGTQRQSAKAKQAASQGRMKIGYHFWNCSRAWDTDLDRCLRIAKETGYQGFEALLDKLRVTPEVFKAKSRQVGLSCAAISGKLKDAIEFASAAGIPSVRAQVPKAETKKWVDYAGERGIVIAVHNHIGPGGKGTGSVETRADLLRYLEVRPGIQACPDTGHLLLCGDDPVQTIHDLAGRLACVHLKDVNPLAVGKGKKMKNMWFELGTGALDVAGVMQALEKVGFTGWVVVEYGNQVEDFHESARRMRQVLRRLGH
jgi:sugar phosphate isomerase/epimerase